MRRLEFVDSLRGLAAVYVAIYHTALLPNPRPPVPHWAEATVLSGGTAVTLFFIVSAFSLCHAMRAHTGEMRELRAFYVRRFFRIAPLFYFMIAFYLLRDRMYFGASHTPWEIAKSALFIFNFFPGSEQGFVWASWTIGVEMAFYAVFPFLFVRFHDFLGVSALFLGSLLATLAFHEFVLHLPVSETVQAGFRHLPVFIFGMLCWVVFDRHIEGRSHPEAAGAVLILGSIWAYHALLHGALVVWFTDPYYWQAVIYSALLLGLGIVPSRVFVNRITQFFGRISYSIYLVHPSVILFLTPVYLRIEGTAMPRSARFTLCVAITLGVVLILATISYRLIEQPGMRLGKHLLAWLGDQSRARRRVTAS